jgi:hypothetical protein
VYAATEAGFYVWKPTSTAIHNEPLFDQSIKFSVTESFVHIESAQHEIQSIGVYSLSGKQIYVPTISAQSQATIPLSSIHESIIIIRVFTQKGTFSEILIDPHHNAMLTREAIVE